MATDSVKRLAFIGFLFALWYGFGSISNIYCKEFMVIYNRPLILTFGQFLIGIIVPCIYFLVSSNPITITRKILEDSDKFKFLFIVAMVNLIGHFMTNYSMSSVSVSFTHTIKAGEPLFSAVISFALAPSSVNQLMWISLVPIIIGSVLATLSELSYTHTGVITAVLSNFFFSSRNIYSKKLQDGGNIDSWSLFLILSIFGCAIMLPLIVVSEAIYDIQPTENAGWVLIYASITHAIYNLVSFVILEYISPISHAIGNSMRRIFIIFFAIVWFGNSVSWLNVIGTMVACSGVFLYSYASQRPSHKKQKPVEFPV